MTIDDPWDPTDLSVLDRYLARTYPDSYAGLARTDDGSGVHIYRTTPSALDDEVRGHLRASVRFFPAEHTRSALERVAARVAADREYWRASGVRIAAIMVPHDGTRVEILSPHATAARAALLTRYGADLITVTLDDIVPLS
ncbi:hypothetical protein GCM10010399_41600 [Dactylosporangium fulvum]|uniref:Uncharacterized protein n=1 Tax=Dactylosporangium fulvum TaxID=53359 RepID=A0ABY5VXB0_9ACTN|nr:hypothetical protein [Dactylosporangium fulvum]UWP82352.1 hypothetical protein Dfulv_46130 [Dactylosporangium fulvum]